jgi:porphobilinogen synthase
MVRETRLSKDSLIYPVFVQEGSNIRDEISSMQGQYRYSVDRLAETIEQTLASGVNKLLFFGLPAKKDPVGSGGYAEDGIVQQALRYTKEHYPEIYCITDVCMCEYTSHGHCGILHDQTVDNDQTLEFLTKIAVSHAQAGADMVAPSDMMDGRILAMRNGLDSAGYTDIPIMSYAVKYSSAYYGPFREAADSAPTFGDRKSYQMDYHNKKEGIKEALTDIQEGADIIMVKPAIAYLDIIQTVREQVNVPVAAYSVSGEYSMIKAAAAAGFIDEAALVCESTVAIYRAGADILITYYAQELANWIQEGRIG